MNVALPFANEPWAYWFVLGITVVIMLLIVILVRRSKLL
jgi:Mg2+ and Co2+ transporter CorA